MQACLNGAIVWHPTQHRIWIGSCWKRFLGEGCIVKQVVNPAAAATVAHSARNCSSSTMVHWFRVSALRMQVIRAVGRVAGRSVVKYVSHQRTGVLLGAVCLAQRYDFDASGISDSTLERYRDEHKISRMKALVEATITCQVCQKRQVLHNKVPGVEYCECSDGNSVEWSRAHDGWMPFLELQNMLVWRKPHPTWPHLYAYKAYGRYDDVSLCAFTETQLCASYRTVWDSSALDLHVLHSDSALQLRQQELWGTDAAAAQLNANTDNNETADFKIALKRGNNTNTTAATIRQSKDLNNNNSATNERGMVQQSNDNIHDTNADADRYSVQDLLYWRVKFPSFFANRDYVFKRRYRADRSRREVVIVNEAVREEDCAAVTANVRGVHRVHHYWSVMVMRATADHFAKNGIEYVLSYFDNPGTSVPSSISNFIASTAFPNFLERQHKAALELQRKHEAGEIVYTVLPHAMLGSVTTSVAQQNTRRVAELPHATFLHDSQHSTDETEENFDTSTIHYIMEALGEMSPTLPLEKGPFLHKMDKMLNDALENLDDNNPLFAKLKLAKRKIDYLRLKGKMKKEESLLIMRRIEERNNRYEDSRVPPILVQQLFETMRDVLRADLEMRTGKSLSHGSQQSSLTENNNSAAKRKDILSHEQGLCLNTQKPNTEELQSSTTTNPNNNDDDFAKNNVTSSDTDSTQGTWSGWFYSIFIDKPAGLFKSSNPREPPSSDKDSKEEISSEHPNNHYDEKSRKSKSETGTEHRCSSESSSGANSYVWYYLYGWFLWPVVAGQSSCQTNAFSHDQCTNENISKTFIDDNKHNNAYSDSHLGHKNGTNKSKEDAWNGPNNTTKQVESWYWKPVTASRKCASWIYSYFTNSKL